MSKIFIKKLISTSILMILMSGTVVVPASASIVSGYTKSDSSNTVVNSDTNIDKYEKRVMDYDKLPVSRNGIISPDIVDPGYGARQITITSPWTSGTTYLDEEKSGTLSTIANIAMTIAGYFVSTPLNIAKDIATTCFGLASDAIDQSKGSTARLLHSFSYYDKLGQVWNGSQWVTKVDIETRQWFKVEYSSFAGKDGYTRSATYDFIPPNGYGPINQDYKPYWSDDQWILDTAYERFIYGLGNYTDAWTH